MPKVILPSPSQGMNEKETVQNLIDVVFKLRKELDFLLQNLDSTNIDTLTANKIIAGVINLSGAITISNVDGSVIIDGDGIKMDQGSISWDNVNPPSASETGSKPYDWFPEYGEVTGLKPPTNADNTVGTIGANRLTYIDGSGIYTGTLTAQQINVIQGIVLGANATIQWASLPSLPNASQVGAREDTWIPTQNDLGGWTTYIDGTGIYTGTVAANLAQISDEIVLGSTSNNGKVTFRSGATIVGNTSYGGFASIVISASTFAAVDGNVILGSTNSDVIINGDVDFSGADSVTGLTAKFA